MMRTMGAIDANTIVVTSVHDSQVVDIPEELVRFFFLSSQKKIFTFLTLISK